MILHPPPTKIERVRSSETSAIKTQTPGNYPKRNILQPPNHLTNSPTNEPPTPQSHSSYTNSSSGSQKKSPEFYGKSKVHYRVHNNPPRIPNPSHTNVANVIPTSVFKFHFNIILQCIARPHRWTYSLSFPPQYPVRTFPPPIRATHLVPTYLPKYLFNSHYHEAPHYALSSRLLPRQKTFHTAL